MNQYPGTIALGRRRHWRTGLLPLSLLACLFLSMAPVWAQAPPAVLPAVRVEQIDTLESSQPKNYVGTVRGKETVNIVPRVSGYLEKVAFQEGAMVKKGDLLFEIEDRVYSINVKVGESVVRQIEAEIELAKRDMERTKTLHEQNVMTDQEMDQARRTIALQEAKLDEAKASLEQMKNDLSYTKVYSPLTGRIGEKLFSEGNYITPGSGVLATIVQYDPIRVKFSLSEADYLAFLQKAGAMDRTRIEILCADNSPYEGDYRMDFLDNIVDSKTGTITLFLECDNEDRQLLPGGYVKVALSERFERPLPSVNVTALMTDGSKHYVFVLGSQDKVERRDIEIGKQVYDRQVVLSGLEPGETVVVGGLNKIRSGDTVRPVHVEPTPAENARKQRQAKTKVARAGAGDAQSRSEN